MKDALLTSLLQPGPPHLPSPALPEQGTGKRVPPELHPSETFFAGDPDPFPKTAKRRWRLTYCRFGRDDKSVFIAPRYGPSHLPSLSATEQCKGKWAPSVDLLPQIA